MMAVPQPPGPAAGSSELWRTLRVDLPRNAYPIAIGPGVLRALGSQLIELGFRPGSRVLVVTNPVVQEHYGTTVLNSLLDAGYSAHLTVIEAGEEQKTPATVALLHTPALG